MSYDRSRVDRRTVLGTLGTGTIMALAGCTGNGDDDADGSDDDSGTQDGTEPDESDGADGDGGTEQLDAPVEVPDEEPCAVCNMVAAEYPDWNAQLVHEDEERAFFCSSGCLSAYYADPTVFDGPDSPVAGAWVTGYESGELVDAAEAHFVRVTDADDVDDIMMMNPTPFANREDAEAFVGEFEKYGEEDIIGFEDFDMDLAMLYRAKFFEDSESEQLAQPAEFPDEEPCAVCNMVAEEHPDWNAQLVHEDEERAFFCSSGCLSAYTAAPQQFGGPDSPVANAWVTGFESRELVDAAEAHFVRVTDADDVDDIMMMNPTPFANREDAEAFVGEFEKYDETDIIGFEDFDMDLAMLYREKFL